MPARMLVIDLGTTSLKVVAYDEAFMPLIACSREWSYAYPQPGRVEHSAAERHLRRIGRGAEYCDNRYAHDLRLNAQ